MIRGTTAQFKFTMPYPKDEWEWIRLEFWQPNNPSSLLPIPKVKNTIEDDFASTDNPKELLVSLTAEETARFSDKYKAKMQLRARHLSTGTIFGMKPQSITVYPMLDNIIEEDPTMPPVDDKGFVVVDGGSIIV